jgi:hypothetical protein
MALMALEWCGSGDGAAIVVVRMGGGGVAWGMASIVLCTLSNSVTNSGISV